MDPVLADALNQAGFDRITEWHLKCVQAAMAQLAAIDGPNTPARQASERRSVVFELELRAPAYG